MNALSGPRVVAYQLPPKWDGLDIEWRGWTNQPILMCPPKAARQVCENCASPAQPAMNVGVVHPAPGTMITQTLYKRCKPKPNGRPGAIYDAGTHEVPARPIAWLHAFRCPDCQLDTVWDKRTDEWSVLEPADYGPQGSYDPRLF